MRTRNIISSSICAAVGAALMLAGLDSGASQAAPAPIPAEPSRNLPPSISLADAQIIIDGALAYAQARNVLMAAVVVDDAGNVTASARMDGARFSNMDFAVAKAFASVMSRQTTQTLSELAQSRPDRYFGIMNMYPGKVYLVGGGVPVIRDGVLVGACGVAGLAQFEDEAACRAGIAAWERARTGR